MKKISSLLFFLFLLVGCSQVAPPPAETTLPAVPAVTELPQPTIDVRAEAVVMEVPPEPAVPVILEPEASGILTHSCADAVIDYSHKEDGYLMVRYHGQTQNRLKVLIKGPTTTYSYNLPQGDWAVFPLSDGSGSYQAGIYKNVTGNKYATVTTVSLEVELTDEFAPFLRPNQYVDYSTATETVAVGLTVTEGLEAPLEKVGAVYDYVVTALTYDTEKAQTVKSGYLPVLDQVLAEGKGICFDYAAVMTAMLRSQEIPCKLVVGYAGSAYHAWISVWTQESGWIDGAIFFDGSVWHRMDPTFASSGSRSDEIMDFIENGNYTVKYLY